MGLNVLSLKNQPIMMTKTMATDQDLYDDADDQEIVGDDGQPVEPVDQDDEGAKFFTNYLF